MKSFCFKILSEQRTGEQNIFQYFDAWYIKQLNNWYLLTVWPNGKIICSTLDRTFATIKFCPTAKKGDRRFKILPNAKKLSKTLNISPDWQNFAKSGHTVCCAKIRITSTEESERTVYLDVVMLRLASGAPSHCPPSPSTEVLLVKNNKNWG